MTDEKEQPQPPRIHKKAVHLGFGDIVVHIETEDENSISSLHQLGLDTLSFLVEERLKYSQIFDGEQGDSGELPSNTTKPLIPTAEPQKLEVRGYQ